jgi:proton glutamate symport protein
MIQALFSQPGRILLALVLGLLLGVLATGQGDQAWTTPALTVAETVGGLWLDALRMTIVPLLVSLLVTGISANADAARAGGITARAVTMFAACLVSSSVLAAIMIPSLLSVFPLAAESAEALRTAMGQAAPTPTDTPPISQFLRSIVPTNPVAAAATDAILPLILFTAVFGFAVTRLPDEPRRVLTNFFAAVVETMLIVINWVLWLAPIGVFALAFVVGGRAGVGAFGALIHYVLIVSSVGVVIWLLGFLIAAAGGRRPIGLVLKAAAPSQAVAISTQSSLASLPSMLRGAERMGVPVSAAGVVLPLAVAIFRATGPAMNLAVALYVAHWAGMELTPAQYAAGIATASITTLGAVSLPGQVSFVTSIAPICAAMGVPIELLGILIAVETIPDIFRTLGNVSMDLAVTSTVTRGLTDTEADAALEKFVEGQP